MNILAKIFKIVGLSMLVLGTILVMLSLVIFGNQLAAGSGKVYNCSVSEFSPDFTTAMREECRKLRKQQHEENSVRKGGTQV